MLKNKFSFVAIFVVILCCEGTIVRFPKDQLNLEDQQVLRFENGPHKQWQNHVQDFINLVDVDSVLSTVVRFIDDPEVMRFIGFLLSPKFKDMVWEFESFEEFKEAYIFLETKGYDIKDAIDYVNRIFNLPEFEKPERVLRQAGNDGGVSGFIAAIVGKLPLQEMADLLKSKVENYPAVAEFIGVIESPEFVGIVQRMLSSEKFGDFKSTFESYGVDFNFICLIFSEVFGDGYDKIICGNNQDVYL
ncbi:uncharacterized protein LOC124530873 [Vanessa cardui]|uniref:uncharacterized protein LOC124530873 n=1 Tax=Vanessa cardui TaxID=171605 RepID=UPI001F12E57A|nr:uncharacterized protein LOC124530873 [Vanessa cardui]